jgi:hypothetical protein
MAQQYRGRYQESNTPSRGDNYQGDRWNYRPRREDGEMEELQELTMISLNIRGFNSEEKHHVIG